MQTIIGSPVKTPGSLVDLGVTYKELPMTGDHVDLEAVKNAVTSKTTMIHIQRSCGYSSERKTIDVAKSAVSAVLRRRLTRMLSAL